MRREQRQAVFYALLRAGLWERDVKLSSYEPIDFDYLFQLADEQSVVGLIGAGLEHVKDRKIVKKEVIPFLTKVVSIEGRNEAMNRFVERLMTRLYDDGITALLVKGQGIAQCYERPQWRSAGDIDLFFDHDGYRKAKKALIPMASFIDKEDEWKLHLGLTIDSWAVELHGSLRNFWLSRVNSVIDEVQDDTFRNRHIREWKNGDTVVLLPSADNDVIFVFSHILQHFFSGGIGLRQICDWCRLIWVYRESLDHLQLETRLRQMGLITEWKAFAAFLVDYLGMPVEALPLYDPAYRWSRKAHRINSYILRVGNFGHNKDSSIYKKYPYFVYKSISFWRKIVDLFSTISIFPKDALDSFSRMVFKGIGAISRGE